VLPLGGVVRETDQLQERRDRDLFVGQVLAQCAADFGREFLVTVFDRTREWVGVPAVFIGLANW
jgi:propanediol dehydratase small subunit